CARWRFSGRRVREVGVRSEPRLDSSNAGGVYSHRTSPRARRRRASANAPALLVRRRWADWIGPPILAMDSSTGLDRPCAVRDLEPADHRADECHGAEPRHEPGILESAWPCDASTGLDASPWIRAQAAAWRNGRRTPAFRAARGSRES